MNIDEVVKDTVLFVFTSDASRYLYLKGGAALHLAEGLDQRLSTDIDFSTPNNIKDPETFFEDIKHSIEKGFLDLGFEVIDFKTTKKPKANPRFPFWGGWNVVFKLSALENKQKSEKDKTRAAIIPEGSNSSKIEIEISEYEFCEVFEFFEINNVKIRVYDSALLTLEKIRAICQQHVEYKPALRRDRARDYYDIYNLFRKNRKKKDYINKMHQNLENVFSAKQVPLILLEKIFENAFIDLQRANFNGLKDVVKGKLEGFDYYNEQLKIILKLIKINK